jgi:hypothetical protein
VTIERILGDGVSRLRQVCILRAVRVEVARRLRLELDLAHGQGVRVSTYIEPRRP